MKAMTCRDLGGACDIVFYAETFEEIAEKSKQHGIEMFTKKDAGHLQAMQNMQETMKEPGKFETWFTAKRAEFEALPDQ